MVRKSKSTDHSESKSPSTSTRTSQLHARSPVSKQEEEESTTTAQIHNTPERLSPESPEVQLLIHKLQGFSITPYKSEVSQSSETCNSIYLMPSLDFREESSVLSPLSCAYLKGKGQRITLKDLTVRHFHPHPPSHLPMCEVNHPLPHYTLLFIRD